MFASLLLAMLTTAWGFTPLSVYQNAVPQRMVVNGDSDPPTTEVSSRRCIIGSLLVSGAICGYYLVGGSTAASAGMLSTPNSMAPVDVALAFLDAYNRSDWDAMRSLTHPEYVFVSIPTNVVHHGRDRGLGHYIDFKKSSPDDHAVILSSTSTTSCFDKSNTKCSGGAVVEVVFTGTNVKPAPDMSVPAKGNKYEIPAVILFDIQDNKVKLTRKYYDMLTLKEQFGA